MLKAVRVSLDKAMRDLRSIACGQGWDAGATTCPARLLGAAGVWYWRKMGEIRWRAGERFYESNIWVPLGFVIPYAAVLASMHLGHWVMVSWRMLQRNRQSWTGDAKPQ